MADPFQDIRDYASTLGYNANAEGKYDVGDDNTAYRIYSHAASKGYKGSDLDSAFGWGAGTSDAWSTKQGLKALTGYYGTAPSPSPSPYTAPYDGYTGTDAGSIMQRANASANSMAGGQGYAGGGGAGAYTGQGSHVGQAAQTKWDESMSAAGRLEGMLKAGGPLMELARTRGAQTAARRGMGSSSMAAEAAQKAMIESASPIAQTDASLFSGQQVSNTEQANAWDSADYNRQMSDAQFGAKLASDESQFARNLTEQARQANLGATTQLTVAGMNYDMQDKRLSQEDKQFLAGYQMEQKKLDTQIEQFAKEFGLSVEQLDIDKNKLSQQDRQFYDGLLLERSKLEQQAAQFATDWENKFSLENMAAQNRIDLANIDAANKEKLIGIEAQYKKDIASSDMIGGAWGTIMQEIGRVQNNPDLDENAKRTLIQNNLDRFAAFSNFWKKSSGGNVDISDLLNFGIATDTTNTGGNTGGAVNYDSDGDGYPDMGGDRGA